MLFRLFQNGRSLHLFSDTKAILYIKYVYYLPIYLQNIFSQNCRATDKLKLNVSLG